MTIGPGQFNPAPFYFLYTIIRRYALPSVLVDIHNSLFSCDFSLLVAGYDHAYACLPGRGKSFAITVNTQHCLQFHHGQFPRQWPCRVSCSSYRQGHNRSERHPSVVYWRYSSSGSWGQSISGSRKPKDGCPSGKTKLVQHFTVCSQSQLQQLWDWRRRCEHVLSGGLACRADRSSIPCRVVFDADKHSDPGTSTSTCCTAGCSEVKNFRSDILRTQCCVYCLSRPEYCCNKSVLGFQLLICDTN